MPPRAHRAGLPRKRRAQRLSTINVPTDIILQALRATLDTAGEEADSNDVAELSALLRLQLRHELQESSLWLVDAFDLLAVEPANSSATGLFGNKYAMAQSVGELEGLSDRFIDGLCSLMQRANFRLFSQRELQFAQQENFMFTLPVDVEWEHLDSGMISRLFVRHPHLGLQVRACIHAHPEGSSSRGAPAARQSSHTVPLGRGLDSRPAVAGSAARSARPRLPSWVGRGALRVEGEGEGECESRVSVFCRESGMGHMPSAVPYSPTSPPTPPLIRARPPCGLCCTYAGPDHFFLPRGEA